MVCIAMTKATSTLLAMTMIAAEISPTRTGGEIRR